MANQKRKVSHIDFLECHRYFMLAIQSDRFLKGDEQHENINQAKQAFLKIPTGQVNDESVNALQNWIDQFVDAKTWGKCYRSINQKRYLQRQGSRTITISSNAHFVLKKYADDKGFNLSEAIISLLSNQDWQDVDESGEVLNPAANDPYDLTTNMNITGASVIAKYQADLPIPIDFEIDDDWNELPERPKRPTDFKQNDSYKKYRERINKLTIKKLDEELLSRFDKVFNYYLTAENMQRVGDDLITLRQQLLDSKLFFTEFDSNDFVISKPLAVSDSVMDSYGYELIGLLEDILGCGHTCITSGKSEPTVFYGYRNHVQIAYKTFNYLNAFLHEEREHFLQKCHKNTKKKNRYEKARWHCGDLVYKLFDSILDDEMSYKLFSEEENKKLTDYRWSKVGRYYDENMPLGGWW